MSKDLETLLDFMRFTHEIREVQRTIHFERDDHQENDAEHSYQLALTAWFLIENDQLKLDKNKCVAMALIHDTIEVYAGDVSAHLPQHRHPDRRKSEQAAVEKLIKRWPSFKSLREILEEYEAQKSPEARFVYALDKLIPVLNIYLYKGRSWHLMDISLDDVKSIKDDKFKGSPEMKKYWLDLRAILDKQPKLFPRKGQK